MLYLVSTPIGNLKDITFRAIEVLKSCSVILCEDTRHSRKLMSHYTISTPLKSFHKFNEAKMETSLIDQLKKGQSIALISDAGTPGISDPGTRLVKLCRENNLAVTPIPGPCAAIAALSMSGLDTEKFQFVGFLPKKKSELKQRLKECCSYTGTTVAYESPHRLKNVLKVMQEIAPLHPLAIARELTKIYEEMKFGCAAELLKQWEEIEVKGEIVVIIAPGNEESASFEELSVEEHFAKVVREQKLSKNEAIKAVAKERKVPKRQVYNLLERK